MATRCSLLLIVALVGGTACGPPPEPSQKTGRFMLADEQQDLLRVFRHDDSGTSQLHEVQPDFTLVMVVQVAFGPDGSPWFLQQGADEFGEPSSQQLRSAVDGALVIEESVVGAHGLAAGESGHFLTSSPSGLMEHWNNGQDSRPVEGLGESGVVNVALNARGEWGVAISYGKSVHLLEWSEADTRYRVVDSLGVDDHYEGYSAAQEISIGGDKVLVSTRKGMVVFRRRDSKLERVGLIPLSPAIGATVTSGGRTAFVPVFEEGLYRVNLEDPALSAARISDVPYVLAQIGCQSGEDYLLVARDRSVYGASVSSESLDFKLLWSAPEQSEPVWGSLTMLTAWRCNGE